MTPDGITTEDWDEIEALARSVAEATFSDDALYKAAVGEVLRKLRELENTYGPLPSILSTRADYVADDGEAIKLLKEAYRLAESRKDAANMTYIASSIAQRFVDDLADMKEGQLWTDRLRACLKVFPDDDELEVLRDLEARLR